MENWLECNGQDVNATMYPELRAIIGAKTPDLRGVFLRGYGSQIHSQNNGVNVGITSTTHNSGKLNTIQGDSIREILNGNGLGSMYSIFSLPRTDPLNVADGIFKATYQGTYSLGERWGSNGGWTITLDPKNAWPTSNEIRPINMAVRYFIRALP